MRLSFKYKLSLVFVLVTLLVAGTGVYLLYAQTYELVLTQLGNRLRDIGSTGTLVFGPKERTQIVNLTKQIQQDALVLTEAALAAIPEGETLSSLAPKVAARYMAGADFQNLVQKLRSIKRATRSKIRPFPQDHLPQVPKDINADPFRILYTYLVIPLITPTGPHQSLSIFLADSDYEKQPDEEGNPIGGIYREVKTGAVLVPALQTGHTKIAHTFITDKWATVLTAGVPIQDADGKTIAVLGIDLDVLSEANRLRRLKWLAFGIVSGISILALILSYFAAQRLSWPIQSLKQGAERVRAGDLNTQVVLQTGDEFDVLAQTFNAMVRQIQEHTENLEQKVADRTQELSQALHKLKASQTQLVQSEKMAMLGQMVAGLAHEINTPLGYMKNNIIMTRSIIEQFDQLTVASSKLEQVFKQETASVEQQNDALNNLSCMTAEIIEQELPDATAQLLEDILYGITQVSELVLSLRTFAQLDQALIQAVDVHDCIDSALRIGHHRLKHVVEVRKNYGDLPTIECSPARINQVILNLLHNAADAISTVREKGEIVITTTNVDADTIQIKIQDNGKGIDTKHLDKIFEPFYTTKPAGEGAGLGLAICSQIIEQHKGNIQVESTIGWGTTVTITLPT